MKELVINKPSELFTIKNRNIYTSLILNCEVNPKLLYGFNNIKELTINSESLVDSHLNVVNLNKLSFIENLEKINLKNIRHFGKKEKEKKRDKTIFYKLKAPNLKNISFIYDEKASYYTIKFENKYLEHCKNLEIINIESTKEITINYGLWLPDNINKMHFKFLGKEYLINFDDKVNYLHHLNLDDDSKKINLKCSNDLGYFYYEIDLITDEIKQTNSLTVLNDTLIKDNTLFIPDYITRMEYYNKNYIKKIEHISFNINLLKYKNDSFTISDNKYLNLIKTIELRTNKEMSLFPSIIIDTTNYGVVNELYIESNKLNIVFKDYKLVVNEEGIISKEELEEKRENNDLENNKNSINLDNYSISELEEYLQYRKLLETYKDNNDEELTNAINVLGNRIVKKLTK